MKRLIVLVIISLYFGACTQTLYSVKTEEVKDIRGNYTLKKFLLYNDVMFNVGHRIYIRESPMGYSIAWTWKSIDWEFVGSLMLRTDDNLYTFSDPTPKRRVISHNSVFESYSDNIEERIISDLKSTQKITIQFVAERTTQFSNKPIDIDIEGVLQLRAFLTFEYAPEKGYY